MFWRHIKFGRKVLPVILTMFCPMRQSSPLRYDEKKFRSDFCVTTKMLDKTTVTNKNRNILNLHTTLDSTNIIFFTRADY